MPQQAKNAPDYGWGPAWMNGLGVASLISLAAALCLQIQAPAWWPLSALLLLESASLLGGNYIVASFRRPGLAVLPLVRLLKGSQDHVLDAGCGSGRTTLALKDVLGRGKVSGVDRFNARYIKGGGRELLASNLALAGLNKRFKAVTGDLAALPFAANTFDSAVSTAVFDHLGPAKQKALDEVFRTLKPGGRFLMLVWVPSPTTFLVGNVFCFMLPSKAAWRGMAQRSGFAQVQEGVHNYSWFLLLEKPAGRAKRRA